ncbi:thioesterase family protein [Moraxella atlantae]
MLPHQPVNPRLNDAAQISDFNADSASALIKPPLSELGDQIAQVMSDMPFAQLCQMRFALEDGQMVGRIDNHAGLIGNLHFKILHGGVAATLLDTIGGLTSMFEIYRRDIGTFDEQRQRVQRIATTDLRIDYLAPGRGTAFVATAEIIRMGRKGCTTRMLLVNQDGTLIAHGMASYTY